MHEHNNNYERKQMNIKEKIKKTCTTFERGQPTQTRQSRDIGQGKKVGLDKD